MALAGINILLEFVKIIPLKRKVAYYSLKNEWKTRKFVWISYSFIFIKENKFLFFNII